MASYAAVRDRLEDPSYEVRIRAVRALGRIGLPAALPHLERVALADPAPAPRAVAAAALGELGAREAVEVLVELLSDPVIRVASHAGAALLRVGPSGVDALVTASRAPGRSQAHACEALALAVLRGQVPAVLQGGQVPAAPQGVMAVAA